MRGSTATFRVAPTTFALVAALALAATGCSSDTASRNLPTPGRDTGEPGTDASDAASDAADAGGGDVRDVSDASMVECTSDRECDGGLCREGTCVSATCEDGVKNGEETDIDCGGPDCDPCGEGKLCRQASDCESGVCEGGACQAPTCDDGVENGGESGVDCGSQKCGKCEAGKSCKEKSDCKSGICDQKTCVKATCMDGSTNGKETDTDCGGPDCNPCPVGDSCSTGSDCETKRCEGGTCKKATCKDGITNGKETDTDCGGPSCDRCASGKSCGADGDCVSGVCDGGTCKKASCSDSVKNGKETATDCGGPDCNPCPGGKNCKSDSDCQSGVCEGGTCKAPSCKDGVENGQESDKDCGGPRCSGCASGRACRQPSDCKSNVCTNGTCQQPTCNDNIENGQETAADCGGPDCPGCGAGDACLRSTDCKSKVCKSGLCATPTCSDGKTNGRETDADCGGPDCPECAVGEACKQGSDCKTGVCKNSQCQKPTCRDGVKNGRETGKDCGGPDCGKCKAGRGCRSDSDCKSKVCRGGRCQAPSCNDRVKNGTETDVDCGGKSCSACGIGDDCKTDGDCATKICKNGTCEGKVRIGGALTKQSPGSWNDGTFAESCAGYRHPSSRQYVYKGATGDGWYQIKPYKNRSEFAVYCDMTTDGGGWTAVTPTAAKKKFNANLSSVIGKSCRFNGVAPEKVGPEDDYLCRYDMNLGFTFDEVRMSDVKIDNVIINGGANNTNGTSDLHHLNKSWGKVSCSGKCGGSFHHGDVRFGAAAAKKKSILSLGAAEGFKACSGTNEYSKGSTITWNGERTKGANDSTLRLEFGEICGGEGWRWAGGRVFVRDSAALKVQIQGGLTKKDPGHWEDGSFAESCQAYRYPSGRKVYKGSTGNGWYAIKPHKNKPSFPVFCDMKTDGGGWTAIDPNGVAKKFGHKLTALSGKTCEFRNGTHPASVDSANKNPTCRYDVDLGFKISEVRLKKVKIGAITGGGTSDLAGADRAWGTPRCKNFSAGDWWWGTPAANKHAIRAGAEVSGAKPCSAQSKVNLRNGNTFTVKGVRSTTKPDTTLRMEFGERGSQKEGWVWKKGRVFVRDGKGTP